MKKHILFLLLLCPLLMQAQYFSGASAFLSLPDGNQERQFYGILGGTFNVSMNSPGGISVIHHNNPFLYDFPSHTIDLNGESFDLEIGPNPASDYLRIASSDIKQNLTFQITNSVGLKLLHGDLKPNEEIFPDIRRLPSGMYYLSIRNLNSKIIKSFPIVINH